MPSKPFFKSLVDNALGCIIGTVGEKVRISAFDKRFPPTDLNAVYDDNFKFVDPDTEQLVSSNEPMVGIRMIDTPKPVCSGDLVYIFSERLRYKVIDVMEDGQGGAVLRLHLESDFNEQKT